MSRQFSEYLCLRYMLFDHLINPGSPHQLGARCLQSSKSIANVSFSSQCIFPFLFIFVRLSPMAERGDDITRKGRTLWEALKKDPVNHKDVRDLLKDGAPPNFREPFYEVRKVLIPICIPFIARLEF